MMMRLGDICIVNNIGNNDDSNREVVHGNFEWLVHKSETNFKFRCGRKVEMECSWVLISCSLVFMLVTY